MRRRIYRLALIAAVAALAAIIFAFSAQEGTQSDALTQYAVLPVAEAIASLQAGNQEETLQLLYVILGTAVRKAAHVCEYALMSALIWLLLRSYGRAGVVLPVSIAIAYALSDEIHQAFVPGRLGTPVDVFIDALGAVAGAWLIRRLFEAWRKKHVQDQ